MAQEQIIRFRIRQDGIVEELVEGVAGPACETLTESIEKKLGDVQFKKETADLYQITTTKEDVTLQHHQN